MGTLTPEQLEVVLGNVTEGVTVVSAGGRFVYANEAAADLLGVESADEVRRLAPEELLERFQLFGVDGRPLSSADLPSRRVFGGEPADELLVRWRPQLGGNEQVSVVRALALRDESGRVQYVVNFFRPVTDEMRRATRDAFVAEAGRLVGSSLDYTSTLRAVADLAVPRLADWCVIDLLADDGSLQRVATSHVQPAKVKTLDELQRRWPWSLGDDFGPGYVIRTREPARIRELSVEELAREVRNEEQLSALLDVGACSMLAAVIEARGRILGAITLGAGTSGRCFRDDDRELAVDLAGSAGIAIDNARLFREAEEARAKAETSLEAEREARERLSFLAEASAVLASSLEYEQTLARVADLAVPRLADWCAIDMKADDGSIRRVAETRRRAPTAEHGAGNVLATAQPELAPESMIVPFVARDRTLGAITLVRGEGGRPYDTADLKFAEDLARRAAVAIDTAQLYRQSEERGQAARVLASVGDGVLLVDSNGYARYWNRAAEAITGLPRSAVVDRTAIEAIPGWESVVERVPISADPVAIPRAQSLPLGLGKRELWLSVSGAAVVDGTVYVFRDLTEERALETLKAEFVSTVSHELRTPLAAIYGAAVTLRRTDVQLDAEQGATLLNVISNESDRLARTVNAILWASRLDTGALATSIERCDPLVLVQEVVDAQRAHLVQGIELQLDAEPDLPAVDADPDKVRQVLVNLVDNAVKYSPDGGTVRVQLTADPRRVRFAVSDEGIGIPFADQRRIFDKFYRVDPDMMRGIGGTGLGLYICRELVRRMNGRIWVTSESGRGSTFAFELPRATPD